MKITNLFLALALLLFIATSCKKDDDGTGVPEPSTTDLTSKSVTTAPTIDGDIEAAWDNCQKLTGTATVPSNDDFEFYEGESYNFTLRSMYDASNIYLLAEWDDAADSKDRQSWYFDATAKLWMQQNKYPESATDKFYEDKCAFMWPVDLGADWDASTCYSICHSVDKSLGYDKGTKHYTNNVGDVADMWHWKRVRTGNSFVNQFDDQRTVYIDPDNPTDGELHSGGRGGDAKGDPSGGYSNNSQTIGDLTVPKYVIPGEENYSWITQDQIDDGTAKLITAVDAEGVLTYEGGTIDPAAGGFEKGTGTMRMPSIYTTGPFTGSRGDIEAVAMHTGTGWIVEFKRALKTSDAEHDVQFDTAKDYMFGFAIFENAAIAHGVKPNLKLTFD